MGNSLRCDLKEREKVTKCGDCEDVRIECASKRKYRIRVNSLSFGTDVQVFPYPAPTHVPLLMVAVQDVADPRNDGGSSHEGNKKKHFNKTWLGMWVWLSQATNVGKPPVYVLGTFVYRAKKARQHENSLRSCLDALCFRSPCSPSWGFPSVVPFLDTPYMEESFHGAYMQNHDKRSNGIMRVISDVMCAAFGLDAKSCVACLARNTG